MKRRLVASIIVLWTLAPGYAGAANEFDYCMVCHGATGNGNIAIKAPKIAGLEPWYVARQLKAFAAGWRGVDVNDAPGHEMAPIGTRLQQEGKLEAAIQFVGSLKPEKPGVTVKGDVERGRQLFATCAGCHGPAGQGSEDMQAPALASRSDWYLVTQLRNFQRGVRGSHERDNYGAEMRAIVAATLPDDKAIVDVVAFINTLN